MIDWHSKGGREWRVTPAGISSRGVGGAPVPLHRTLGEPWTMRLYLAMWGRWIVEAAQLERVPVAVLLQVIATENGPALLNGQRDLEVIPVRREPGYIDDAKTPHRISVGPCHLLISTAREAMGDPRIDRAWLADRRNNIRAAARYISQQRDATGLDPVLVGAAYNAGGVYLAGPSSRWANRWGLRTYGSHIDRAVSWYGDGVAAVLEYRDVWALDAQGLARSVRDAAA